MPKDLFKENNISAGGPKDLFIEHGVNTDPVSNPAPERTAMDYAQLGTRALAHGVAGAAALPGDLAVSGANALLGTHLKTPSQGFDEFLTKVAKLPQPETSNERLSSDVISGVTNPINALAGPLGVVSGGTSALASGATREAGFGPLAQFGAGVVGGLAPFTLKTNPVQNYLKDTSSGGNFKLPTKSKPISSGALEKLDADAILSDAVTPVKKKYNSVLKQEGKLWDEARDSGKGTTLQSDAVNQIPGRVENVLNAEGVSLDDDHLKPLAQQLSKFSQYKKPADKFTYKGQDEGVYVPQVDPGADVSEIVALRRGVSSLAGKHTDGNVRYASKVALNEIDDHLADLGGKAIISGDEKAIKKFQEAISFSKQKFKDFGTNKKTGQNPLFEKLITKTDLDNSQLVDAFGTTSRGLQGTAQFIKRSLKMAPDPESVRSNLAKGYIARAIQKSTTDLAGGEKIINPGRFRVELERLATAPRSDGGIGNDLRNVIFTPEQIEALSTLKNNIKEPKSLLRLLGVIGVKLPGTKIPLGSAVFTKPEIVAGRNARKLAEDFLTGTTQAALPKLKGNPVNWKDALYATTNAASNTANDTESVKIPNSSNAFTPEKLGELTGNLNNIQNLFPQQQGMNVRGPNGQPAHLGRNSEGDVDYIYDPNATGPEAPPLNPVLQRIKHAESAGKPDAKNPNSTASGLYQFTDPTWKDLVKKYGKETGISVKDKNKPEAQEVMANLFLRDNSETLKDALGRDATDGELYMAHFLGAEGAKRLISNLGKDVPVTYLFPPDYIRKNRSIFMKGTRPRTVDEVYSVLASKVA